MTTITSPLTSITLAALVPDVVRSCVVLQPSPPPDPGEEPPAPVTGPGIYTPIAPGVTYANLPVAPTIVDTSPDQMIGCIVTVADNPQGRLNALFPSAVDGDGVIDRATNDIWVYDGATWNNVGPTPGPTITATTVIPPWNETLLAVARTRTKLSVNALAYALELLTEPDAITTRTVLSAVSSRTLKVPATDISIAAETPSYDNPYSTIYSVFPVAYQGTSASLTISALPWSPGIVWIKSRDLIQHHVLFDSVRGAGNYILPSSTSPEVTGSTTTLTAFTANGFTLSTSLLVNSSTSRYVAWCFPPVGPDTTNTAGTVTSTVNSGGFYNIIRYTGTGAAGITVGHGLPATPTFIFARLRTVTTNVFCGGSLVTDNTLLRLDQTSAESASTDFFRTEDATTFTLGSSAAINTASSECVAYAFCDVPRVCKGGTYTGDGNAAGLTVNVGFRPDFLIVKRKNGTGGWVVIDKARDLNNNQLNINSQAEFVVTGDFYDLTDTGFVAKRGSSGSNHDLNVTGGIYLYLAFSSFRPTVLAPLVDMLLEAEEPTVTAN